MPCGVVWIATRCMLCMYDGVECYVLVISISTESMCGDVHICISMAVSGSCMCMRMCSRQYVCGDDAISCVCMRVVCCTVRMACAV